MEKIQDTMNNKDFIASGNYLISEVKTRAEKGSPHFFDVDSMRFFHSRVSELCWKVKEKIYFITSEAQRTPRGMLRAWTVRHIDLEGDINTLGEFQEHGSLSQARKAIKELIEAKKIVREIIQR